MNENRENIKIEEKKFEETEEMCYLGSIIQIQEGNKKYIDRQIN